MALHHFASWWADVGTSCPSRNEWLSPSKRCTPTKNLSLLNSSLDTSATMRHAASMTTCRSRCVTLPHSTRTMTVLEWCMMSCRVTSSSLLAAVRRQCVKMSCTVVTASRAADSKATASTAYGHMSSRTGAASSTVSLAWMLTQQPSEEAARSSARQGIACHLDMHGSW